MQNIIVQFEDTKRNITIADKEEIRIRRTELL